MSYTEIVPPADRAAGESRLRQLCVEGLARRYTLRARTECPEFIIEGVEEPARLPTSQSEVGTGIRPVSGPVPAPGAAAAISAVVERLQLELKAIEQAGLAAYFLLVAECARYGRSIGASCLAIGSCPGSLVTYLLEISTVDPIRHGLLFERFWNPERVNPPAIYLEFADDRRDEVIEYPRKMCGRNPVAHLVTDLESDLAADLPTLGLLGLKALTVLRRTCERVRQTKGIEVPIDHLPLDDAKTYKLLRSGDTSGIFQLESGGMPALCRKLQISSFEHISALVALYRPGPMDFIPDFIKRRHGKVAIDYEHPLLESISKETYGVLIYQEQVMQAAQILAGYTLGSADLLRRAMAKSKFEELAQHRRHFVEGAKEWNSIPATKANQLFDWLEKFAGYGFNKSHAYAYAMVAYQTAYLKANYLDEFRDAQGEEWDTLIPEQTQFHEFPDWEADDPWWQRMPRERWRQSLVAEYQVRRVNRPPSPFAATRRKPPASKQKPPVGSEGIFYLVRYPKGWRFWPVRVAYFPIEDFSHAEFWEEWIADCMAEEWQPEVSERFTTVEQLRDELLPLTYAFPRGRVVSLGRTFAVYHGDNLAAFMQSDRTAIETAFDIQGNVQWEFDEHQQCVAHDRDRMRELLGLKETWPAVSVNRG